ncbi:MULTISPECIES: hypothetical protein [Giesbergeria]|uniref:Uncharacterized protein n=1 Tax=Giesbergeria sinuosa TaxID=80883 RepID=A0ABV9QHJ8_9BURK
MPTSSITPRPQPSWQRGLAVSAAILVLLAVFALYTQPSFMVLLADQVWSCF